MNKLIFCTAIALFLNFSAHSQTETVNVPEGVVYKYCSDSVNIVSKEIIRRELSAESTFTICDKLLFCGPLLWKRYKDIPGVGEIEAGNMTILVPKYNKKGKLDGKESLMGKMIQSHEDFITFWKQVIKDFEGTEITIRKLRSEELSYYWAIIFFDIEEPIFAVENGTHTLLFDMDDKGQLLWIEQLK